MTGRGDTAYVRTTAEHILSLSKQAQSQHHQNIKMPLNEQTRIVRSGDFTANQITIAVEQAFDEALASDHNLPDDLIRLPGMTGRKYRYFINNLVRLVDNPRYLEVGSYTGSSVCAAIASNRATAIAIDNWSQFDGPKDEFLANIERFGSDAVDLTILEQDFRTVGWANLPKSNIYLFDGPHAAADQYDGLALALPALDDTFVFIVDDYNWTEVRDGTARAIADLGLVIDCGIEILTTTDDTHPTMLIRENSDWHNGYFIAVLRKPGAD